MEGQTTLEEILKNNPNKTYPRFEQLDEAVIGVTDDDKLIYSNEKCIQAFMKAEKWDYETAQEWFYYNVECARIHPTQSPKFTDEFDEVL